MDNKHIQLQKSFQLPTSETLIGRVIDEQNNQFPQNTSIVLVKKDRQIQYDEKIRSQWRNARAIFYSHQLRQKLNDAKIQDKYQTLIIDMFVKEEYKRQNGIEMNQLKIDLENLGELTNYKEQIQSLRESIQSIKKYYQRKKGECLPLQQIISQKLAALTAIHIQYQQKLNEEYDYEQRYSISAFGLFKIIHENKLLSEVTIKGVSIKQFQQFIRLLNCIKHEQLSEKQQQSNESNWVKSFNPSKILKLSISALVKFDVSNGQNTLSKISDLLFFRGLFHSLSDIFSYIYLGQLGLNQWTNPLQELWKCLKQIKRVKIQIEGINKFIPAQSVSAVRSVLFGGLSSFTQITQISFKWICFDYSVIINDFLAIQNLISTLFQNNTVIRLKLYGCQNVPVFPVIATLETICLWNVSFRKQVSFMSSIANPYLRSIKCSCGQEWGIDQRLFNQLQTLMIDNCNRVYFDDISPLSPSNIKNIQIWYSNVGTINSLTNIFPKLVNLTKLQLCGIDFSHQLALIIPSPHLKELIIMGNDEIIDQMLKIIDCKWPQLKYIKIHQCRFITDKIWNICKFIGLRKLEVDRVILGKGNTCLSYLKGKGIQVNLAQ